MMMASAPAIMMTSTTAVAPMTVAVAVATPYEDD
jgi:hypothetical protein